MATHESGKAEDGAYSRFDSENLRRALGGVADAKDATKGGKDNDDTKPPKSGTKRDIGKALGG